MCGKDTIMRAAKTKPKPKTETVFDEIIALKNVSHIKFSVIVAM